MKKIFIPLLLVWVILGCGDNKNIPDVSGIEVNPDVKRFDQGFFAIDTSSLQNSLSELHRQYPEFLPLFLQNIIGVEDLEGIKTYYRLYSPVYDSAQKLYRDFDPVKKQIERALQYVKYYFPAYPLPAHIITVVGPMNSMEDFARMGNGDYTPDFIGPDFIGISLQFYLGSDFSLYQEEYFVSNVAPRYRSRRFSREYIISDVMKLITEDIFPDKSKRMPMVEQMIQKGKQWWMLDKLLPEIPDSVKTGYTRQQLEWCNENEGLIWSYIIKNSDINTIDPVIIQTYIGEAPFTANFSPEYSPGNLGQWIGWQIVKKFAGKNSGMKPEEIMQLSPRKILDESKYKPK